MVAATSSRMRRGRFATTTLILSTSGSCPEYRFFKMPPIRCKDGRYSFRACEYQPVNMKYRNSFGDCNDVAMAINKGSKAFSGSQRCMQFLTKRHQQAASR